MMEWTAITTGLPATSGECVVASNNKFAEWDVAYYNDYWRRFFCKNSKLPILVDYWIMIESKYVPNKDVWVSIKDRCPDEILDNKLMVVYHDLYNSPYIPDNKFFHAQFKSYYKVCWLKNGGLFIQECYSAEARLPGPVAATHWFCPPEHPLKMAKS